ncbi:MAG: TylF/MycF family methyltransferase [Oscillospiraceae bacterium]|nr:TylF/MycF family methyltransferase [Oscillospiraceae bacterium]
MFFVDNNYNNPAFTHTKVLSPSELLHTDFDYIYIAAVTGIDEIYSQLINDLNVSADKIISSFSKSYKELTETHITVGNGNKARIDFLNNLAFYIYKNNIDGNTAELGVYQGHFAKEIMFAFPDRKLFLFDTFEGFDERDLSKEKIDNLNFKWVDNFLSKADYLKDGNVNTCLGNLNNNDNCIIKKGFFPETFDLENENFVFVNIDTDLYQPTKAGLEIFYPLMSRGGVILIHDYFGDFLGVQKAVDEFVQKQGLTALPIGDLMSIAIVKN